MTAAQPSSADARLKYADTLCAQGRPLDAAQVLFEGVKIHPGDFRIRHALAGVLNGVPLDSAGPAVREVLLDLCRDENIATQALADAVIGLTRSSPAFPLLLDASLAQRDLLADCAAAVAELAGDPLLNTVLARAVINDPDLERVLTHLRRCMLLRGDAGAAVPFAFACALARQCFNNEYAFYVADGESGPLQNLRDRVGVILRADGAALPSLEKPLVLAALYAPLNQLPGWERLLEWPAKCASDAFRPIWQDQVIHYRQEKEIAGQIEALTPITNEISQAVRGQYEDSPYPRWFTMLRPAPVSLAEVLQEPPSHGARGHGAILIAGCGTGQHPIHAAMRFPDCDVVALDLSKTSLSYAIRMAQSFGVKNVEFFQADILELDFWARRFDLIESLGVLHHMKDPLAGWRALTRLLGERGAMRIGLYSAIARRPLLAARDIVLASDIPDTAEGIRRGRRTILDLPAVHPARCVVASDDFFSASGCRDLIMHVHEHSFTLPQIADCLRELDLEFLGLQSAPEVTAGFRASYPNPAALTDLSMWHQFEQRHPEIFRGMYHFSCRKKR